jgi:signal transduction histidine kinase
VRRHPSSAASAASDTATARTAVTLAGVTVPDAKSPGVEVPLLRAVVGYRLVAAVWLGVLAALILAELGRPAERPGAVALTVAIVATWTAVATVISVRRPSWLPSLPFILADTVLSVISLIAADWAGTFVFAGGYPLAAVFATLQSRGTFAGMVTAGALSVTALARLGTVTDVSASDVSFIVVYLFTGGAAAWTFSVIRNADRRRSAAEDALLAERTERARADERTAMAARIHDSVLQTLALIQREGDDQRRVRQLARQQERELRSWLFGADEPTAAGFKEALQTMGAEVEALTGITAAVVVVGNAPWSPQVEAIAQATREALLNAAKHAKVDEVAVYGEAGDERLTVFVRDRGIGFVPEEVPAHRRGIADSMRSRLAQHRGAVAIRSAPGGGTEVHLDLPLAP